jgi:SNF2 family DNA or RNA helicase
VGTGVKFHVLFTTPEHAMMDMAHLEPICRAMIAVDEAHRLENNVNELHRSLTVIFSANRLLVPGTPPLHILVAELWELLKFLNPDQFDDPLHLKIAFPFLLWEMKSMWQSCIAHCGPTSYRDKVDVEKSLPKNT